MVDNCSSSMNCLPDELVREILCRVGCHKYVIRCKAVSSCWLSLISSNDFILQFLRQRKIDVSVGKATPPLFDFAIRPRCLPGNSHIVTPYQLLGKRHYQSITLPDWYERIGLKVDVDNGIVIEATCHDLILCRKKKDSKFYVCSSVMAGQWVDLPSLPQVSPFFVAGLACTSYSSLLDTSREFKITYNVVIIPCTTKRTSKLESFIYSSETGAWLKVILSYPKPIWFYPVTCGSFLYNDMLHFYELKAGIMGLNLQDGVDTIRCNFIDWPRDYLRIDECLIVVGVSQGTIRLCQHELQRSTSICVWDLKDYTSSYWERRYKIDICGVQVLGLHPFDDVVYLQKPKKIFWCDLKSKEIRPIYKVPLTPRNSHYLYIYYYYPIMQQWWPTPLHNNVKAATAS